MSDSNRRLAICRKAILDRNFTQLAEIIEQDSLMMHAVMMTSTPALIYLNSASIAVMKLVHSWRIKGGYDVCFTFDAGPNAHVICQADIKDEIINRLEKIPEVLEVIESSPGGPARVL